MRRLLAALLVLLSLTGAHARDDIEAGPYGMVLADLMLTFHATEVACEDGMSESNAVCFQAKSVGVAYLAERLTSVVESYAAAGLSHRDWRAANGVWTVTLEFKHESFGRLEVYLAESMNVGVRGLVRLVPR